MKRKLFLIIFITLTFFLCGLLCFQKTEQIQTKKLENENVLFSLFQGDEKVDTIPSKDSGYYFDRDKSNCTNDAQIEWDSVNWSPAVSVKEENQERVSCNLYFTTNYREGILNGTDPVLKDEMIPITLENDGTVKKADLTKPWYSYADKKWANAVLLQNSYDALEAEGKVNSATKQDGYVSFDGVDDYIDLGLANYDFDKAITVSIKLKFKELSKYMDILDNYEAAGFGISYNFYRKKLNFTLYSSEEKKYQSIENVSEISPNTIINITATFDGSTIKLYLNGSLDNTIQITTTSIKTSVQNILIGANPEINNTYSGQSLIDVYQAAIYNRVLSEEEIKNNMANEIKVTDNTGLLKYVDFTNRQNYEANEVIPEDVIESYFVWIPKYRYKLWDLGNYDGLTSIDTSKVHAIDILFGDYNTDDSMGKECTTPMTSGATGNCKVGDYMTHPAFISIPSTGFWVGKFTTGYKGASSSTRLTTLDVSKIIIKPNTYGLDSNLSTAHLNAYNYHRELDSHVMKNTEWGAVAYLQHSEYGSSSSIRLNNNSSHKTGYAANNEPTCGYTGQSDTCNAYCNDDSCNSAYNTQIGYLGSTTGNIYGVYDMAGMSTKLMGIMLDESGNPYSGTSKSYNTGFNGKFGQPNVGVDDGSVTELTTGIDYPDSKYYDAYSYNTTTYYYKNRILGDATGEMGPYEKQSFVSNFSTAVTSWYGDLMDQNYTRYPVYERGYSLSGGTFAGIFALQCGPGRGSFFRMILTPTKGNAS